MALRLKSGLRAEVPDGCRHCPEGEDQDQHVGAGEEDPAQMLPEQRRAARAVGEEDAVEVAVDLQHRQRGEKDQADDEHQPRGGRCRPRRRPAVSHQAMPGGAQHPQGRQSDRSRSGRGPAWPRQRPHLLRRMRRRRSRFARPDLGWHMGSCTRRSEMGEERSSSPRATPAPPQSTDQDHPTRAPSCSSCLREIQTSVRPRQSNLLRPLPQLRRPRNRQRRPRNRSLRILRRSPERRHKRLGADSHPLLRRSEATAGGIRPEESLDAPPSNNAPNIPPATALAWMIQLAIADGQVDPQERELLAQVAAKHEHHASLQARQPPSPQPSAAQWTCQRQQVPAKPRIGLPPYRSNWRSRTRQDRAGGAESHHHRRPPRRLRRCRPSHADESHPRPGLRQCQIRPPPIPKPSVMSRAQ